MHGAARSAVAHLVGVHAVEPRAVRIGALIVLVGQRRRIAAGVPLLAACRAGVTADAGVEIDHQAELLFGVRRQRSHGTASALAANRAGSGSKRGEVSPCSSAAAFSMLTRRSYQAACPVIGSLLEKR